MLYLGRPREGRIETAYKFSLYKAQVSQESSYAAVH